jgi:hypothetical protein
VEETVAVASGFDHCAEIEVRYQSHRISSLVAILQLINSPGGQKVRRATQYRLNLMSTPMPRRRGTYGIGVGLPI